MVLWVYGQVTVLCTKPLSLSNIYYIAACIFFTSLQALSKVNIY